MNQIKGEELYEMYHTPGTKEKAILWAYDNSLNEIDIMTRKICNNASKEDLEDVRQALYEIFLKIIDRYDYHQSAWSTWLSRNIRYQITETISQQRFGTSRYKMITYGLKQAISLNTTVSWDEKENTEKIEFISASVDIEHDYIEKETQQAIRDTLAACFDRLPAPERTIMRYSMGCDKNAKEIAQVLGMSEKEVRNKMSIALKELRKMPELQKLYQFLYGQEPDSICGKHKRHDRTGEKINGKDGVAYF